MAVTYDFQTPGVSTSAADTQEDIRNIAEMSWVWHVQASPHSLTNKPTGLIEAFYSGTVDFASSIPSYGYQNYYSLKAYDGTNLGNVNFIDLYVHYDGAVLSNTIGARGEEFISMGVYAGYSCEDSASWIINADVGNSGSSGYDPILAFKNQTTERARIYTDTSDSHKLKFDVGGSDQMVIDSSGNVGIGTSAPSGKLDVNTGVMSGDVKIGNFDNVANGNNTAQFGNGTKLEFIADTNPKYSQHDPYTVAFVKAEYSGSGADTTSGDTDLVFATYDGFAGTANGVLSEKMRITADGNVGIGTSSPNASLDVVGQVKTRLDQYNVRLANAANTSGMFLSTNSSGDAFSVQNNAGTTRLHIDNGGNVGIGTSSPAGIIEASDTNARVYITSDSSNNSTLTFRNSSYYWNTLLSGATGSYSLYNGSVRMSIDSSGNVEVNTGNLVIGTSGKGIDFSATSDVAGATSELLDDYEEGTFTPTLSTTGTNFTSVTYDASKSGSYTKIGRTVFFTIFMGTDSITKGSASGGITVAGLPFASNSTLGVGRVAVNLTASNFLADAPIIGTITENTSYIQLSKRANSVSGDTALQVADIGTGANANFMSISGSYQI